MHTFIELPHAGEVSVALATKHGVRIHSNLFGIFGNIIHNKLESNEGQEFHI